MFVQPLFAYAAYRDDATRPVLKSGWVPILMSMFISGYLSDAEARGATCDF